jgi:hypothetical protein
MLWMPKSYNLLVAFGYLNDEMYCQQNKAFLNYVKLGSPCQYIHIYQSNMFVNVVTGKINHTRVSTF